MTRERIREAQCCNVPTILGDDVLRMMGYRATAPYPSDRRPRDQVTQRPGWSSLATSVNTLTGGSQAIARLGDAGLAGGSGRFRTSSRAAGWAGTWVTGIRTTTEVSARPTVRIVIVSVGLWRGLERHAVGLRAAVDLRLLARPRRVAGRR